MPSHGHKNHVCVDGKYKLVRKSKVTDAASHEGQHLPELRDEDNASKKVRAEGAYQSQSNNEAIASKGLRPFIMARKPRGQPMPRVVVRRNAAIAKVRSRGEHPFAEFKCRLKLAVRTKGLKRADFQIRMTNLVYEKVCVFNGDSYASLTGNRGTDLLKRVRKGGFGEQIGKIAAKMPV